MGWLQKWDQISHDQFAHLGLQREPSDIHHLHKSLQVVIQTCRPFPKPEVIWLVGGNSSM